MLVVDDASLIPARKQLRDARDRAAHALQQLGARTEQVSLKQLRRALEIYLAALGDGAAVSLGELLDDAGVELHGCAPLAATPPAAAATTRFPSSSPLALERLNRIMPDTRTRKAVDAARALREEMKGILGDDGILLHPPHPRVAPRHGSTVGRAWVLTPAAVFNLLGLPVTEVPLGLNPKGCRSGSRSPPPTATTTSRSRPRSRSSERFGGWVPPA